MDTSANSSLNCLLNFDFNAGFITPLISDDLPDPETPVIQVKRLRGISAQMDFKLFLLALLIFNT